MLQDTRAFDGSGGVEVVVDVTDPTHVLVIERWASLTHDDAYREWRAGAGASGGVRAGSADPLSLRDRVAGDRPRARGTRLVS